MTKKLTKSRVGVAINPLPKAAYFVLYRRTSHGNQPGTWPHDKGGRGGAISIAHSPQRQRYVP